MVIYILRSLTEKAARTPWVTWQVHVLVWPDHFPPQIKYVQCRSVWLKFHHKYTWCGRALQVYWKFLSFHKLAFYQWHYITIIFSHVGSLLNSVHIPVTVTWLAHGWLVCFYAHPPRTTLWMVCFYCHQCFVTPWNAFSWFMWCT